MRIGHHMRRAAAGVGGFEPGYEKWQFANNFNSRSGDWDGTQSGGVGFTADQQGTANEAALFNSAGQKVSIGNFTPINGLSKFTLRVIARPDSSAGSNGPAWSNNMATPSDDDRFELFPNNSALVVCVVANGANANGRFTAPAVGNYRMYSFIFDGTKTGNDERLIGCLDGVQKTLGFSGTIPATLPNFDSETLFGRREGTSTLDFSGAISEIETFLEANTVAQEMAYWNTVKP